MKTLQEYQPDYIHQCPITSFLFVKVFTERSSAVLVLQVKPLRKTKNSKNKIISLVSPVFQSHFLNSLQPEYIHQNPRKQFLANGSIFDQINTPLLSGIGLQVKQKLQKVQLAFIFFFVFKTMCSRNYRLQFFYHNLNQQLYNCEKIFDQKLWKFWLVEKAIVVSHDDQAYPILFSPLYSSWVSSIKVFLHWNLFLIGMFLNEIWLKASYHETAINCTSCFCSFEGSFVQSSLNQTYLMICRLLIDWTHRYEAVALVYMVFQSMDRKNSKKRIGKMDFVLPHLT